MLLELLVGLLYSSGTEPYCITEGLMVTINLVQSNTCSRIIILIELLVGLLYSSDTEPYCITEGVLH